MRTRLALLLYLIPLFAVADDLMVFHLQIRDHLFYPSRLEVPSGVKFKLIIENRDATAEEFDSFDLNREKVVFPERTSTIYVGPLEPGQYDYFGEYNSSTARGVIIAVDNFRSDKLTDETTAVEAD